LEDLVEVLGLARRCDETVVVVVVVVGAPLFVVGPVVVGPFEALTPGGSLFVDRERDVVIGNLVLVVLVLVLILVLLVVLLVLLLVSLFVREDR